MENIFKKLLKKEIRLYELERVIWEGVYKKNPEKWAEANKQASLLRLRFLENKLNKNFKYIKQSYIDTSDSDKFTIGIEQKIGGAITPLGIAGPIKILGEYANGEFYLPVATNEAALISGLNRGCKTINESGGIKTVITRDWMTRAPLIEAPDIEKAKKISEEIKTKAELYNKIKQAAESESRVSKLLDIQPFQSGRFIHLRFYFQTGDSMGMNSATKYAANGIRVLKERYPWLKLKSLTANLCTDKKASHINILLGRGKGIETQVLIPGKLIKKNFDIKPEDIANLNYLKNYQGSALAGTISGFNANVANTIAGMFIACGQDAAQVVESSSCFTHAKIRNGDLLFGITLPCLEIATTGGGTGFGTAKECLEILGCYGHGKTPGDNVRKLAEIIAAGATAQELNLLCAEAHEYELAESHIKLARGK
jgi:hydroxymethylglutaryl-CoA reductase (NADPH)